jgi:AcrR family transcriptional regulator
VTQGLRERKKAETRRQLWRAAITLFTERGFDHVSVAEVAAAANVSKMTAFNYFSSKEDLVVGPMEEHIDEPAQVVRARRPGQSAVAALREHFLARLAEYDPITGLSDDPVVLSVRQLVERTPALNARLLHFVSRTQEALAAALAETTGATPDDLTPRLAAAQLVGVQFTLIDANQRAMSAGQRAPDAYPAARASAQAAFELLEHGLRDYGAR